MADEVRIQELDYSKPEVSIPGICILRPARGRDGHEGRNRNQIKKTAKGIYLPDLDGKFSLSAEMGNMLQISYVGYISQRCV